MELTHKALIPLLLCVILRASKAVYDWRPFAQTDDQSRRGMFEKIAEDKVLENHVIAKYLLNNEFDCLHKCMANLDCKSFNFEQSLKPRKRCWLNSETRDTKPSDFVKRTSFAYFGWEKPPCVITHCKNGGTCVKGGIVSAYKCSCPYGYTGVHCETYRGYDVKFTNPNGSESLTLQLSRALDSFTICFWIQTAASDRPAATVLSYVTLSPFTVVVALVIYKNGDIELILNGQQRRHPYVPLAINVWYQMCVSWENQAGKYKLRLDGSIIAGGTGVAKGAVIPRDGSFTLGKCPGIYSRCFPSHEGKISSVNMWSKVLTEEVIMKNSKRKKCEIRMGDVFTWPMFQAGKRKFDSSAAVTRNTRCKLVEQSLEFDLKFPGPRDTVSVFTVAHNPSPLIAFTASFFAKYSDPGDHTFLSYATVNNSGHLMHNAICIVQRNGRLYLHVNNKIQRDIYFSGKPNDGIWHHFAVTWENKYGHYKVYYDGKVKNEQHGFAAGEVVKGNGTMVLGNDQDHLSDGFTKADAMVGTITRLNIWDSVLPDDVIRGLSAKCGKEVGNFFSWQQFKNAHQVGNASWQNPSTCSIKP